MSKPSTSARWVLIGIVAVALILRAPITGVPPVLDVIAGDLDLSPALAGFTSTLPLLCFGAFAFLTPILSAKVGQELTLWVSVFLITIGIGVRLMVGVTPFYTGTLLIGLGIALSNVVVPSLARTWFQQRLPFVMGLYSVMLQVSGSSGPFVTSTAVAAGLSWPGALGLWLIPAILILLVWSGTSVVVGRANRGQPNPSRSSTGLLRVMRMPIAWLITFVMGTQSMLFYTLVTWLPTQFRNAGLSNGQAGLALTIFVLLGLPGSLFAGKVVTDRKAVRNLIILFSTYIVGVFLLWLNLLPTVLIGAALCGLCQGVALVMALTFIAHQRDPADVPGMSALAQGLGYLFAALGPVAAGWVFGVTGSLRPVELGLIVLSVLLAFGSVVVARHQRDPDPLEVLRQ